MVWRVADPWWYCRPNSAVFVWRWIRYIKHGTAFAYVALSWLFFRLQYLVLGIAGMQPQNQENIAKEAYRNEDDSDEKSSLSIGIGLFRRRPFMG
jgi:hypothetical protein